jgi:hypothetical protein
VKARANLVEVISSAHSPLPEVVSEDVVAVSEFVWVSLGLGGLWAGGVNVGPEVNIDVVKSLRRSESQVIVTWGSSLSEPSCLGCNKAGGIL